MSPKVSNLYRQKKRTLILQAAQRAFIRKGYELTTMKDIIDESGLSRGGVYLYFPNTEEIFLALMAMSDDFLFEMIRQEAMKQQAIWHSILELSGHVRNWLEHIKEGIGSVIYEYFMTSQRDERAQKLLDERFQKATESMKQLLDAGIEKGEFHPSRSTSDISIYVVSFLDGLAMNLISHGDTRMHTEIQMEQLKDYLSYVLQVKTRE